MKTNINMKFNIDEVNLSKLSISKLKLPRRLSLHNFTFAYPTLRRLVQTKMMKYDDAKF